ncbi:hypothetical protein BSR28_01265 [Boudabousia liubingyangii]|nr:hypothetical protein BSR28_01265 [Boudabousia liubingyangii]
MGLVYWFCLLRAGCRFFAEVACVAFHFGFPFTAHFYVLGYFRIGQKDLIFGFNLPLFGHEC